MHNAIAALLAAAGIATSSSAQITTVFETDLIGDFLLIGMGPVNDFGGQPGVGQAVNVNNFELGANKNTVPAQSGSLLGPGLAGNVPDIPMHARPVSTGVSGDGNVAITNPRGSFNLQDVGVYADRGILTAASRSNADDGTQNSFFNDPNMFPNTFTSTGLSNPGVSHNIGGFGSQVNPNDADQSTRIDANNFAGVTGNVDHTALLAQLQVARTTINQLASTQTIDLRPNGGKISVDTVITLDPGLNVIDINTGDDDFLLENSNLVIDGDETSKVIFRIDEDANFNISNSNILAGLGLGPDSILFYTDKDDNDTHFNFSNTVLNDVAFWSLANEGGEINIDNAQGCVQLVADKITLNDVRFGRCDFSAVIVPAPSALAALAASCVLASRRRR